MPESQSTVPPAADPPNPSGASEHTGRTTRQCNTCGMLYDAELCPKCISKFAQASGDPNLPDRPFGDKIGRYLLEKELGAGGSGVVWLAKDPTLNRSVALKILSGASKDDVARFEREATTAAALQHPNIAPVFEVGTHENRPFIAMQYVSGHSLDYLVRHKRVAPRDAASYIRDASRAVHYAHQSGIIHRDLKPQNIMVQPAAGSEAWRVYVMDFGLARKTDVQSSISVTGMLLGTPAYMSPEQARGSDQIDQRSDIYGLGATLYALVTGRPPHEGLTPLEIVLKAAEGDVVRPRMVRPDLHPDLETIIETAMAREPERRYPTAAELAADLQRFLDSEPIKARPASIFYTLKLRVKRHPAMLGTAALVLIAVALAAALLLLKVRDRNASDELMAQASASWKENKWSEAKLLYEQFGRRFGHTPVTSGRLADCEKRLARAAALKTAADEAVKHGVVLDDVIQQFAQRTWDPDKLWKLAALSADALDTLARSHPDTPEILYQRARASRLLHRLEPARADIDRLIELDPTHRPARIERVRILLNQMYTRRSFSIGEPMNQFIRQLCAVAAKDAEVIEKATGILHPQARIDLSSLHGMLMYFAEKQYTEARRHMENLANETRSPDVILWYAAMDLSREQTRSLIETVVREWPMHARGQCARGMLAKEIEDPTVAIAAFTEAIRLDPYDPLPWGQRGARRYMADEDEEAEKDIRKAIELDPHQPTSWYNLSVARLDQGDRAQALEYIDRAIEIDPGLAKRHSWRALIFEERQDYRNAIPSLSKAIELDGETQELLMRRASAQLYTGRLDEAASDVEKAIAIDPDNWEPYVIRADLMWALKRLDAARANFELACEKGAKRPTKSLMARASFIIDRGEFAQALNDMTYGCQISPTYAAVFVRRAEVLRAMGKYDGALADLDIALGISPQDGEVLAARGLTLIALGRVADGVQEIDASLKADPDNQYGCTAKALYHESRQEFAEAVAMLQKGLERSSRMRFKMLDLQAACKKKLGP